MSVIVFRPRAGAPSTSWFQNFLCSREFFDAAERLCSTLHDAIALTPRGLSEISVVVPNSNDQLSDSVVALMDRLIRDVIRAIARNAAELEKVEWRILERVVAAAFEELGFNVHLTRSGKDGGKDLILECMEHGTRRHYIVEVKHWVCGKAVPGGQLRKFLNVVVNEKRDSGLFLSTSGFARNAGDALVHLEHKRVRMGDKEKILSLCQLYVTSQSGLLIEQTPTEVFFQQTDAPVVTTPASNSTVPRRR
jgi:restriction endonuclease Mrr